MQVAPLPTLNSQETLQQARALLDSNRGSALPELVGLIATLSKNIERISISELVETIEPDPVLLARILAVANKLPHNPGIARVATLDQAIHQIGFARVRNTALSLLLLDHTSDHCGAEVREAAALALTSGLIAHGAGVHLGTHDPELAFACASLRNLGRVFMASLSPALYREAVAISRREPGLDGFRRCFGLSPVELSRRLTAGHQLPELAVHALREGQPEALPGVPSSHDTCLLALSDYACRLAQLALDPQEHDRDFVRATTALAARYRRALPALEHAAVPVLLGVNRRLRSYVRGGVGEALPLASLRRIRQRVEVLAPGAAAAAERAEVLPLRFSAAGIADPAGAPPPERPRTVVADPGSPEGGELGGIANSADTSPAFTEVAADVKAADDGAVSAPPAWEAAAPSPAAASAVPSSAMETVKIASAAEQASEQDSLDLMCAVSSATEVWWFRAGTGGAPLAPIRGLGCTWQTVPASALVWPGERSIFGIALAKDAIVLIHDVADATLQAHLPRWWAEMVSPPPSFALVSVRHGLVPSVLLVGWTEKRRVALSAAQVDLLRRLASAVVAPGAA